MRVHLILELIAQTKVNFYIYETSFLKKLQMFENGIFRSKRDA